MPFIFHSKKQSIFDTKPQSLQSDQINFQYPDDTQEIDQENYAVISMQICREHPFRKFQHPFQQDNVVFMESQKQQDDDRRNQKIKNLKSRICKSRPLGDSMKKNISSMGKLQLTVINDLRLNQLVQSQQKSNPLPKQLKQTSNFKKPTYLSQQRLAYNQKQTPGPGSYNPPLLQNAKPQSIYPSLTKTFPLPQRNDIPLIDYIQQLENKVNANISERDFNLTCSYKHQSSPCFKPSVLGGKKNGALLGILFSNKTQQSKGNHSYSQSTNQSKISSKNQNTSTLDDEYVKVQQTSPSPFSYDPQNSTPKTNKQAKVFISGSPKFSNLRTIDILPGPGHYRVKQTKNEQDFDQNQNKQRPNQFEDITPQNKGNYVFSSSIPRQLDFGMGEKGGQQLYYSPKTGMVDSLKEKENKSTLSNQFYFGSSLQRFNKDKLQKNDPYKYCFAKLRIQQENGKRGGMVISSKGKRDLYPGIKPNRNPGPFAYNTDGHTLQKSAQETLVKLELQSRYNQQVVQLREKKSLMERVLVEERRRALNLRSVQKQSQPLYPNSYKEYLMGKKTLQKKNISFGYNKNSMIDRGFKPKVEVDGYYETEYGWDLKSFNKHYGYEVFQ